MRCLRSICLLLLVALAACAGEDPSARVARGLAALERGDTDAAAELLESALERLEPEESLAIDASKGLLRARARQDPVAAAAGFQELAASRPYGVRPEDWSRMGQELVALGAVPQALELLDAGFRAHPADERLRELGEAIRAGVDGRTDAPRLHWLLGRVYLEKFQRDRERDDLQRALDDFVASLDFELAEEGDGPRVTTDDRLQANLGQGWCYFWRGVVEDGDYQTSEFVFAETARTFPESVEAHVGLGLTRMYQDRPDEARAAFDRAIRLDPEAFEAWFNLGQLGLRSADWPAAAEAFERALELRPEHVDTLVWLATALGEQGHSDRPRELLGRALRLTPEHVDAMVQLGTIHALDNRWDQAQVWFDRALQLDPTNGNAYLQRGKVMIAQGDHHRGLASLGQACSLLPESFEAHYNLGAVLANSGAAVEALRYLRQAREIDPDHPLAADLASTIASLEAQLAAQGAGQGGG